MACVFLHTGEGDLPIVRRWGVRIGNYWRGFFLFSQKNKDGKVRLGTLEDALTPICHSSAPASFKKRAGLLPLSLVSW